MDSKTVRRTGTAMSATADVSSRSTTASTRRMLEPPYTGISQNDLPCGGDAERCNHWSCTMHNWYSTAQHSTAQHSTAQHSTAQHSTAQHSTAQHSSPGQGRAGRAGQGRAGQGRAGQGRAGQAHVCQWQKLAIQRRSILQLRMLGHMPLQHLRSSSSRRSADGYIWIIQVGHDMVPHKLQQVILSKVKCAQGEQGNSNQGWPLQFPCARCQRTHLSNVA